MQVWCSTPLSTLLLLFAILQCFNERLTKHASISLRLSVVGDDERFHFAATILLLLLLLVIRV